MTQLELLLTCLGILVLGIVLLILTGFIGVQKGCIAVIEKRGLYAGTYTKRWVYFFAFAYEAVGIYPLNPLTQNLEINGHKFALTYQILDAKTFHYSGHDVQAAVSLILKDKGTPTTDQIDGIIRSIGCACIDVKGD